MSEFKEKLTLMLIEKLALALIIALVGYLISWKLERYKAVEARNAEFAKRGLISLEAVWDVYMAYEPAVNRLAEDLKNPNVPGGTFAQHANEVRDARQKFEITLDKNEVWLPKLPMSRIREILSRAQNLALDNPASKDQLRATAREIRDQLIRTPGNS